MVTFTNIHGEQKARLLQIVADLGGIYSGALKIADMRHPGNNDNFGTTHLVCGDGYEASQKFHVAVQNHAIHIVRPEWLLKSFQAQCFLPCTGFYVYTDPAESKTGASFSVESVISLERERAEPTPASTAAAEGFLTGNTNDLSPSVPVKRQLLHFVMTLDDIPERNSPAKSGTLFIYRQQKNTVSSLLNICLPYFQKVTSL